MSNKTTGSVPNGHHVEKKRMRTLKSCLHCRQKKIKCDQAKPACGSCIKKGVTHLCQYEDTQWSVKVGQSQREYVTTTTNIPIFNHIPQQEPYVYPQQFGPANRDNPPNIRAVTTSKDYELMKMNERIRQLEEALRNHTTIHDAAPPQPDNTILPPTGHKQEPYIDDHVIDFYKQTYPAKLSALPGTLSWVSLLRKDVYLNSISLSTQILKSLVNAKEKAHFTEIDKEFYKKFEREDQNTEAVFELAKEDRSGSLISELQKYLNDSRLIWLLVDRFFDSEFYLMLPVLDQDEFNIKLLNLIGPRTASKVILNLKKRAELTTIGILLIVMRLTSLVSYNFGKESFNKDEKSQYINSHPIDKNAMALVGKIYQEVSSFKSANLETYQFMILRLSYDHFAPEECDCIKFANSSSIGQVLQYAIQSSLNRDPDLVAKNADTKRKNLLRRLWYSVVYWDSYQLMSVGCPPIIDSKFYDTHFPHLNESTNESEYAINEWYYECAKLYEVCYPLLMSILNVRVNNTVNGVKEHLRPLLSYTERLKGIQDILQAPRYTLLQRWQKIKDFCCLVDCHSLLYIIYYHFFLFYNEKQEKDLSLKYLIAVIKLLSSLYEMILFLDPKVSEYDLEKHFGIGAIVFPKIESTLHKTTQLMFALLSRIKGLQAFTPEMSPEIVAVLDEMISICTNTVKYIGAVNIKVSEKYYHPWVANKAHLFILNNVLNLQKDTQFNTSNPTDYLFLKSLKRSKTSDEMFSSYDLDDLTRIKFELMKFDEINAKYGPSTPGCDTSIMAENDKLWLDQPINNISTGTGFKFHSGLDTDPNSLGNSEYSPKRYDSPDFLNVNFDFLDTNAIDAAVSAIPDLNSVQMSISTTVETEIQGTTMEEVLINGDVNNDLLNFESEVLFSTSTADNNINNNNTFF